VFCNGFPQQLEDLRPHDMVVVNDFLQGKLTKSTDFTLYKAGTSQLICIYLCQNLFHKSDGEVRSRSFVSGLHLPDEKCAESGQANVPRQSSGAHKNI
jgi:hypothetical protein